jgi:hypothetical protein
MSPTSRLLFALAPALGISILAGAVGPQARADAMMPMTTAEMMSAVIGNSISGQTEDGDSYTEYYAPDGTIHGASTKSGAYRGAWHFRQDQVMCFKYGDGPFDGGCVHLALDGDRLAFIRIDGTTEPSVRLIKGNPNDL